MFKTENNNDRIKLWIIKVINSCETPQQINTSKNLVVNFDKLLTKQNNMYNRIKIKNELIGVLNSKAHNLIKK
jgi:hypothetical protein